MLLWYDIKNAHRIGSSSWYWPKYRQSVRFHFYNEAKISLVGACKVDIHGQTYSIFMLVCFNNLIFSVFSRSLVRNTLSRADEELCHVMPHQTPAAQQRYQAAAPRTWVLFSYLHRSCAKNTGHLFFSPKCKGGRARSVAISEWELICLCMTLPGCGHKEVNKERRG